MSHAPPRDSYIHFVDVFGGGGSVLLAHDPEGKSEVLNDIDGLLMNFWRVISNPTLFEAFHRMVCTLPVSRELFESCLSSLDRPDVCPLDRAVFYFVVCRQSMSGRGKEFSPLSRNRVRRGMNEQAAAWLSAVEGLPRVHERLINVVLLQDSFLEVFASQDGPQTWFYCDPPYLSETRNSKDVYRYEMTRDDHVSLLGALLNLEGKVMLSGYDSDLYNSMLWGWRKEYKQIANSASASKKKRKMTEVLWMNY